MEVLHTSYIVKSKLKFIDADLEDPKTRNSYAQKTPTLTLPFLETKEGNISQSISIETFLSKKYKPEILGSNTFEKAKINQWIEFASCEIQNCAKELIYPIFKGKIENKGNNDNSTDKQLKKYLALLEKEFKKGNKYIMGNRITLADIVLFRYLRFFFMFYLTEKIRNSLCPKLTSWFENIMNSQEAIEAYGRTLLCKKQLKPMDIKIEKNKNLNKNKKEIIKEKNPLDSLPPSKFDIKQFKKDFFEDNNKKNVMENFWKEFDNKGYSLWLIEYNNIESEGKKLFRMKNSKNFFLERIDDDFKNYAFGVHGVYGNNNEYKVKGVWMWRGLDIPEEIKDNEYFEYLKIKKLRNENDQDKKLIEDYWTKCKKGDKVDDKKVEEVTFFY